MKLTLAEIAERIGAKLHGSANTEISALCSFEDPQTNAICFSTLISEKALLRSLRNEKPAALIISSAVTISSELKNVLPVLQVENPFNSMIQLMAIFHPSEAHTPIISKNAEIHSSAKIGKNVTISAFCVVGPEVVIADDVVLHPHVVLYKGAKIGKASVLHSGATVRENCIIGENCIIQNGVVIGAEGFGYVPNKQGHLNAVPQVGTSVIADNVDIGANSCVDRAALGKTRIGLGTKIDNLVQVGHNVQIGQHSAICAGTGIGGSSKIGSHVILGGLTGVADHVSITDGVRVGSSGKIERDINEKGDYAGHPLMKVASWKRMVTQSDKMPELFRLLHNKK